MIYKNSLNLEVMSRKFPKLEKFRKPMRNTYFNKSDLLILFVNTSITLLSC
jgi:hypothetical protein